MRAVTWQGKHDVRVETVPDPTIQHDTDAVIRVTSTAICGSDLHLYDIFGPFLKPGDVLGHETMGVVEAVGSQAGQRLKVGDRVVVPFNISCGTCWMCTHGLQSQCETTQVTQHGTGAALFGYTELYGEVPGGQAEYLRVPQAQYGPIVVPHEGPDEQYLYLSDILPTAWQGVAYAATGDRSLEKNPVEGNTVVVLGLGPVGQLCVRVARLQGAARVIAVDRVTERLALAAEWGAEVVDQGSVDDVVETLLKLTGGRGPDAVIDAVGMEAHGSPVAKAAQTAAGMLPKAVAQPLFTHAGVDRLDALHTALRSVRRGGTVSLVGVYGGAMDPVPMLTMFDRQVTVRMGQCNVRRWTDAIMPCVTSEDDVLGLSHLATHRLPLSSAPAAYAMFQQKSDGCIKVVLDPAA
ncbi:molecular chaperone GroES [Intrasporangium chromatireducens Q5-1]|uniref:Molecular chaperone GroES n=1 Tax=Intrasporangium chromatireducens Q5-1 TaxID=584657 RepID=W9GLM1_9MICO|nr:zinc-dependent alcohol dehydrogenase [Intrasporangium chromatireducens]EWT04804.1 molecular chaperone GroES [Intrasporangium chromatireducens Q5-1]